MTPETLALTRARTVDHESTGPMHGGNFLPYEDSLGILTIGYGCAIGVTGLYPEEAAYLLDNRLRRASADLDAVAGWWRGLDEIVQSVLLELMYQLGQWRFLGFRKMLAALQRGDRSTAAAELLDSRLADQAPKRTRALADLLRGHP